MNGERMVIAGVGTFHLLFDRFVDWMESWSTAHPEVRVICQHGVSRPMHGAENHTMLAPDELIAHYRTADIVVLQGGAGGIMDAREAGRVPIIVPRTAALGEMVDDHQVHFMRRLASLGVIHLAETEDRLHRLMDGALSGTLATRAPVAAATPGGINLAELLTDPVPPLPRRERARRGLWALRQIAAGSGPLPGATRPEEPAEGAPYLLDAEPLTPTPQQIRVQGTAG